MLTNHQPLYREDNNHPHHRMLPGGPPRHHDAVACILSRLHNLLLEEGRR